VSATGSRRAGLRALTVQGWVRLVFAVIAVLIVAAAVLVIELLAQSRARSDQLQDTILPAQAQAYRMQGALVDQETGVRGYGITGDTRFLQPYITGRAIETSAVARLRVLVGPDRPLAADLAALTRAAASWRGRYAIPLIDRARHGPLNGTDAALLDQSKQSFDHLRVLFAAQNAHLARAAAAAVASQSQARARQDWAYAGILAFLLLTSAALAIGLHRAVLRPLGQLRAASQLVADGDYSRPIEPVGPADLRAVAGAVEAMRSELVTALDASRAAGEVAARQAADLDAQAAELRRSNGELEQFAYVASHDLQEPLRKVAAFCQLLEKRYGSQLDDRGLQYIAFAVDGAKRMQTLINDLLTFSRVGRAHDVRVAVRLDQPLDRALSALSAAIEESAAVVERPAELPLVTGDPTLLGMLWQNLVGNAIKFHAPDRAPVVRITAVSQPDGMWRCCVADNGIGVPPEFAEKIFVIFQRLHGRDAYPGTGIGLALCRRIIEQHGGEMHLDTGYTGGTRICFTLPGSADGAGPQTTGSQATCPQATRPQATPEGIPG